MEKIRLGVIGVGWVAQIFHLPILKKFEDVEVVAICDSDKRRVEAISERFGISRTHTDYQWLLKEEDIQAVIVSTPTDLHKPISIAALEAGKDVFVEKPVARHYEEAVVIAEAAKKHKRKLMVGMNNRFRPDAMILKSFIEKDDLGGIFYARAGWLKKLTSSNPWITRKEKAGGGVFLDLGIVMLDLVLWMTGFPEVHRVSAKMYNHRTQGVEDSCIAFLEMKYGVSVSLEVSWSFTLTEDYFYCNLYGSVGSATINPMKKLKKFQGNTVNVTPEKFEAPHNLYIKSYENELKHFVGAARGLHPIISTADEATHRMRIVKAIYESAEKGKEVILT